MNINSSKPPEGQGPSCSAQNARNVQQSQAAEQKDNAAPTQQTGSADRVDISGTSKEIADIMSAVNQLPDVRNDKVQAIKQSIDAGTYSVDAGKVASSIINSI